MTASHRTPAGRLFRTAWAVAVFGGSAAIVTAAAAQTAPDGEMAGTKGQAMPEMPGHQMTGNATMADMGGTQPTGMLLFDQLETINSRNIHGQAFQLSGWYGRDEKKLWLRSEGSIEHGKVQDGDVEALWNHAIAPFWGTQLGVRHDLGKGPSSDWLAFGIEGLSPYWFKLELTGYLRESGEAAARLRATYEVLFTQRVILEPELEVNVYDRNAPERRIGSGLSDASLGMRLRYEIRREFAPYVGINWVRRVGKTAAYARQDELHVFEPQLVAGVRFWF